MKKKLSDVEGFSWDFTFMIYKTFDASLKCPKWVKKNYLQQCSKELQVKKKKQIET
jgi:hypothetical protein